jgi:hypothetical protein
LGSGKVRTWRDLDGSLREQILRDYPDSIFSEKEWNSAARSAEHG